MDDEIIAQQLGFPLFPLYDSMLLRTEFSETALEWLLDYGSFFTILGGFRKGFDTYFIERPAKETYQFSRLLRDDSLDFLEETRAEEPAPFVQNFPNLEALRRALQHYQIDLLDPHACWKWDCHEATPEEEGWIDEHGKKLPRPAYFQLPTFPLADNMLLERAYPVEEFVWMLEHGRLERVRPPSRSWKNPDGQDSSQELVFHTGQFCLIEYMPGYRGDAHDQALVTVRKYALLSDLLQQEQVDLNQLGMSDEKKERWHWTYDPPLVLANGGSL